MGCKHVAEVALLALYIAEYMQTQNKQIPRYETRWWQQHAEDSWSELLGR